MIGKLAGWDETIVALATPPGIGAIGVIRLSGKKAIEIVNGLFQSKDLTKQTANTLHVGLLKNNNTVLDEVVLSLFKAPASYTGEDVIEISCHGSPYVQQQVIAACIEKGARLAKAGEFTQRAFLNGKLDLTQAEAVADLIASNSEASRKSALHNIRGGFSSNLKELRDQLLSFSALIELELDFSQEDVEFADRTRLYDLVKRSYSTTSSLLNSFQLGNVIKNGVQVAIVGKPNAGKSTLLNTLLNENRAIVSDIAGTTRDTIEEILNIDGILFRLIDTAGIREHTSDIIESIGVEKSREKIQQADVALYLFDVNTNTRTDIESILQEIKKENSQILLVANKIDNTNEESVRLTFGNLPNVLFISAKEHRYIEVLKERLVDMVLQGNVQTEGTIVTNARHYEALQKISTSLADIVSGMDNKLPGDLLALDIRRCLHFLGEITGEITNEDQLDYIFSKFCIGK
ncbi:tRNA uridine-5-carboxymethylaminomethyl(34) synthesis GTPase MnmE [Pinibacter aurantiacus]|uniref:tRNA modification GTPase MnmE n=1 Tax=Pinibacter aurantiacus TaxID=2851599 RepID=A0A9E2S979_9BACT|nr:tRNA uridine-5-carboxymethylaminomethyl(34) synthesis GTPase MnmE [Pinibacter aurantiacus]MBV4357208.1 tRNA uridine-5-carboxymethylaminomethyl(34) synthesis GTPase MnmE [Pinibacter aurantiacus]